MRQFKNLFCLSAIVLAGSMAFTACSSTEDLPGAVVTDQNGTKGTKAEFVMSIPKTVVGKQKQVAATVQKEQTVATFRGMDNIRLLSFTGEIGTSSVKKTDILSLSAIPAAGLQGAEKTNYKVYADQFIPVGTDHFLFYGKAIDDAAETAISTADAKFKYGVLQAKGLKDAEFSTVADIMFSEEQIVTSTAAHGGSAAGTNIITLLNKLAKADAPTADVVSEQKWSTSTNPLMQRLYRNFTTLTTSSTPNVEKSLSNLYTTLVSVEESRESSAPLAAAIRSIIDGAAASATVNGNVTLKDEYQGFPTDLNLPVGAARVYFNASTETFEDVTANYNNGLKVTKFSDYVYPAALWYWANSPLKASTEIKSQEYGQKENWNGVINDVYSGAKTEVEANTQSVAMTNQVQYAVGRLDTRIKMESGDFYDAFGKKVNLGSGFTLKGILIGGQNSVRYDFAPNAGSTPENYTIYDRDVVAGITANAGSTTPVNYTLALQTASEQTINMALELVNNGEAFQGADGAIPAGGTFYLAARLDPKTAGNYDAGTLDKIFYQDHTTDVIITIRKGSKDIDGDGKPDVDTNGDGQPDKYVDTDGDGVPDGVDVDGDGNPDPFDIDDDGNPDDFITDPDHGGPGWDTDGDGDVDRPILPDPDTGNYPDTPADPEGLSTATNGVPDLSSPNIELGTSVNLEWLEGLKLTPQI